MKLSNIKRLALASAAAFCFAGSGPAWASGNCAVTPGATIDAQVPFQIELCAQVENDFAVDVTDVDFGDIGVTGWVGESGCLTLNPDGTFDETNAACLGSYGAAPTLARIVTADDAGSAPGIGQLALTAAFPNQEVRMWFQENNTGNSVDALVVAGGPSMYITALYATTDALGVGGEGANTQDGLWIIDAADDPEAPASLAALDTLAQQDPAGADGAMYKGVTDAATGHLTISLGATIQTDGTFVYDPTGVAANGHYPADDYEGAFEVVLFY